LNQVGDASIRQNVQAQRAFSGDMSHSGKPSLHAWQAAQQCSRQGSACARVRRGTRRNAKRAPARTPEKQKIVCGVRVLLALLVIQEFSYMFCMSEMRKSTVRPAAESRPPILSRPQANGRVQQACLAFAMALLQESMAACRYAVSVSIQWRGPQEQPCGEVVGMKW